jgi:hypothetical protein
MVHGQCTIFKIQNLSIEPARSDSQRLRVCASTTVVHIIVDHSICDRVRDFNASMVVVHGQVLSIWLPAFHQFWSKGYVPVIPVVPSFSHLSRNRNGAILAQSFIFQVDLHSRWHRCAHPGHIFCALSKGTCRTFHSLFVYFSSCFAWAC